jgi:shikimate kinase
MHIYLIGFMGVGKSTLGKKLANKMRMPFIDTDVRIEKELNKSVDAIFKTFGEDFFREKEREVLHQLSAESASIVATGGGLPCYFDNIDYMNAHGLTIYLKADSMLIYQRLVKAKKPRPLINSMKNDDLHAFIVGKLQVREPYYSQSKLIMKIPLNDAETLVNTVVREYEVMVKKG